MIIDLPDTSTGAISKKMVQLRDSSGTILNRVLTLLVVLDSAKQIETAVETVKEATREHPCRILMLVPAGGRGRPRLDGQIRVGGHAGASEIIVLTLHGELAKHAESVAVALLLPDSPIVTWWPGDGPVNPSQDPLGRLAQRRLVDASQAPKPIKRLYQRAPHENPVDTDLGWARTTRWRSVLAAALDQEPYENVERILVVGSPDSPSATMLAAWLGLKLKCPVELASTPVGTGIVGVKLFRTNGSDISLIRPEGSSAVMTQPGQPDRRINLARRPDREVLAEELRRLDADEVYADVVRKGLKLVKKGHRMTAEEAIENGHMLSREAAVKLVRSVAARDRRAAKAMGQPDETPKEASPGQRAAKATTRASGVQDGSEVSS